MTFLPNKVGLAFSFFSVLCVFIRTTGSCRDIDDSILGLTLSGFSSVKHTLVLKDLRVRVVEKFSIIL
jgi:hypothetical protein